MIEGSMPQDDFAAQAKARYDARTRTVAEATKSLGLPPEAMMDVFAVMYGNGEAQGHAGERDTPVSISTIHNERPINISTFRGEHNLALAAGGEDDIEAWEIALLVNAGETSPLTPQQIGIELSQLRDEPVLLRVQPYDWPDGLVTLQIAITLDAPTNFASTDPPPYLEPWVRANEEQIIEMDADSRYAEVRVGNPGHLLTREEREVLMRYMPMVILTPRDEA